MERGKPTGKIELKVMQVNLAPTRGKGLRVFSGLLDFAQDDW
jgi:hypothetical protein